MIKVKIDTSPLADGNAIRGVGVYTRLLKTYLSKMKMVEVLDDKSDEKPDIIHYPFFDLFFSTLPLNHSIPIIVTVHDVIPLRYPKQYPAGVKGKLRFLKQRAALQKAAAVITDSQSSKLDIIQFLKIEPAKIRVVPLAGNPELEAQPSAKIDQVRKQLKLPKEYLLYVGDINYNKNIPQLIKMLKFLPDKLHLVCVGKNFKPQNIPEWQWIETQVAMSNVDKRVHFVPNLSGADSSTLAAIYSGATAYVQPSLYEGFGLPVLEAMQCKTPVVSSNTSSLEEVAANYAVLVEPEAESLARGVTTVISWSNNKRQQQLEKAYLWSKKFSWKKTAQKTYQVYETIV